MHVRASLLSTMAKKDYYGVLGVDKSASQDEIKSAYRKLAKQYHPDLHPGDQAAADKFKEINEAYSVVGDETKRGKYDRGELDNDGFGGGYNPFGQGGFSASGFDDIFDMFSSAFGGGFGGNSRKRTAQQTGSDISYKVQLSFMESILGCKKTINFKRIEKCGSCDGTGAKDSSSYKVCDRCGGSGQVRYQQNTIFGVQVTVGACDRCGGSGHIVTDTCKTCGGKGVVSKDKVINVTIPAGIENGSVLQISGEGNAPKGKGGKNGNLLLILDVKPSKVFERNGLDLYVDLPVSFATAVCGGEVEVPSPDGVFIHKIAENTQNGTTVTFRGKGIRSSRGSGNLIVKIVVEVPTNVSRQQKKAILDFERDCTVKSYPKRKAFLDEVGKLYEK